MFKHITLLDRVYKAYLKVFAFYFCEIHDI